jgi:hypothetical protein
MHDRCASTTTGYDWSRFGRHRLRAPAGVLIDSPVGFTAASWLGTLWNAETEPCGWTRMLWEGDHRCGGWIIPSRLAGGDVLEFGAQSADGIVRWYGIVDSYDAVEWLTVQGPYSDPTAAYLHAQVLLAEVRYREPLRGRTRRQECSRRQRRRT